MAKNKHFNQFLSYDPPRCWVGESHKIIYATRDEAEAAALVAEYDHHTSGLGVYKCEYGNHWHITSTGGEA